jgi:hypothetical protein
MRATSHMSQEPWPCNGEDPWLSSKDRTMGVSKAVSWSHGLSSIVWSESGPCSGTIAYFVGGKREEDLVQYNMSQTLSNWENYLVVFVCPWIYYRTSFGICHAICPGGNHIQKIIVSKNLRQAHLLEMGPMIIPGDHETLSIVFRVDLHVDFSSMKSSLGL